MTNLDLLEAIGDVDEALIEELNQSSVKGHKKLWKSDRKHFPPARRVFTAVALTACAAFFLCILVNQIFSNIYVKKCKDRYMAESQFAKDYDRLNPEHIREDTIDDRGAAEKNENVTPKKKAILGDVQINQLDSSLYANAKFGGTLKEVSEEQWQKQYGKADFLEGNPLHKKKYYLSYSKQNKVLYGLLDLELSNHKVEMRVDDGKMLDSPFEEMKKTKIGWYEIAICQSGEGGNYAAIIPGGDAFYTIEESEMTLEAFEELIERIFDNV